MARLLLVLAALGGFTGVALGAFAAHGLKARLSPEYLAVFQTGTHYQLIHSLALLAVALLMLHTPHKLLRASGALFAFGIVLFSAQQFLSAVHPRVTGNAATKVLGRTDSVELSDSVYRFLDPDIKMHLTRLEKGELILSHPIYRQPVKVNFPKPPFRQGRVRT